MIPNHQRRNHEKTDELLNDLDCLLVALDALQAASPPRKASRAGNAAGAMLQMALDKIKEAEKARSREWVGLGGSSNNLTSAEIAEATGA